MTATVNWDLFIIQTMILVTATFLGVYIGAQIANWKW